MDSGTANQFDEVELSFMLLSLDKFEETINEFKKSTDDPTNLRNADLNLGFIASARQKFNAHDHNFTLNEIKALYCAVDDRRDFINKSLDDGFDNDDDQLDALACLRITNNIIRKLKNSFAALGIDIVSFLNGNSKD